VASIEAGSGRGEDLFMQLQSIPSLPGLSRQSTSCLACRDVDARLNAGHDDR
jgi:hypothetical protein